MLCTNSLSGKGRAFSAIKLQWNLAWSLVIIRPVSGLLLPHTVVTGFMPSPSLHAVARIIRPTNALQLCRWQFSYRCYGWGATSENRWKIDQIALTRSLWSKISGTMGRSPPIIFAHLVTPMNALQLCPRQFSHSYYGWGATSENRSKIGNLAPTRSLSSKISGTRSRPAPIIFAHLVRPMNALQLCRWQFSHKETL